MSASPVSARASKWRSLGSVICRRQQQQQNTQGLPRSVDGWSQNSGAYCEVCYTQGTSDARTFRLYRAYNRLDPRTFRLSEVSVTYTHGRDHKQQGKEAGTFQSDLTSQTKPCNTFLFFTHPLELPLLFLQDGVRCECHSNVPGSLVHHHTYADSHAITIYIAILVYCTVLLAHN